MCTLVTASRRRQDVDRLTTCPVCGADLATSSPTVMVTMVMNDQADVSRA